MKRFITIIALALALLLPSSLWAAAGTCTQAYALIPSSNISTITFTCIASADDQSFPSTATSTEITAAIKGMYIIEARTNPGTAPTANYDIVLNDADGIDLMGGTMADRSATVSQRSIPALSTGVYGGTAVDGAITLVITGNSVNSAVVVVKVFLTR